MRRPATTVGAAATLTVAVLACSAYAFAFTYGALKLINRITPVRVGEEAERGLDEAMHGETAYTGEIG